MATLNVLAGDFKTGKNSFIHFMGTPTLSMATNQTGVFGPKLERISIYNVESIELASEDSVKKFAGAAGWGLAGAALLGPVGLLAGVLAGGNKKESTFIAVLKDGRKFMATTDSKTYTKLRAARL